MNHTHGRLLITTAVLALALCACDRQKTDLKTEDAATVTPATSEVSASVEPENATMPDDAPTGQLVELPLTSTSNEPLLLATGQSISGEFEPLHTGKVMALAVQVGTFVNTSQGKLTAKVCNGAGACGEGSVELSAAPDNDYLRISLGDGVQLAKGQPGRYTLTRTEGESKFVVWTYPGTAGMTLPDGSSAPRVPKLALQY